MMISDHFIKSKWSKLIKVICDLINKFDGCDFEGHEVAIKSFEFMRGFGFALTKLKLDNKVLGEVKSNQIDAIFKGNKVKACFPWIIRIVFCL